MKRQVGVGTNPPAYAGDSMLACPIKANQATALLQRARSPTAEAAITPPKRVKKKKKKVRRDVLFYYSWTVICSERGSEADSPPPTSSMKPTFPSVIDAHPLCPSEMGRMFPAFIIIIIIVQADELRNALDQPSIR